MRILYLGDIMGSPGRSIVASQLCDIRVKYDIDVVIAQSENVSHGKAMSLNHYNELRSHGVDIFTGGNHTFERADTMKLVADSAKPVTAPGNINKRNFPGYKIYKYDNQQIFVASILGYICPDKRNDMFYNQLKFADEITQAIDKIMPDFAIVNYHGDLSSEKVAIGHYLDGKVTAVVGDHWHVPSADFRVLPGGTAHVTDVGMCGTLNSSLGATYESVINRWSTGNKTKLIIAEGGETQINGVIIEKEPNKITAKSITQLRLIF